MLILRERLTLTVTGAVGGIAAGVFVTILC